MNNSYFIFLLLLQAPYKKISTKRKKIDKNREREKEKVERKFFHILSTYNFSNFNF